MESRFAISNGFLGVRGSRATTRGERWVMPAAHLCGRAVRYVRHSEHATPGLVPAADWLQVRIAAAVRPCCCTILARSSSHRMTLDMRRGALLSEARHSKTPEAVGMHVRTLRLVSLSERAVGLQLDRRWRSGTARSISRSKLSFEGVELGLVTERLGSGSWRLAHPAIGQGPRHGDRSVAADRWPRTSAGLASAH